MSFSCQICAAVSVDGRLPCDKRVHQVKPYSAADVDYACLFSYWCVSLEELGAPTPHCACFYALKARLLICKLPPIYQLPLSWLPTSGSLLVEEDVRTCRGTSVRAACTSIIACSQRNFYHMLTPLEVTWCCIPTSNHASGLWEAGVKITKSHPQCVIDEHYLT
ncbi:hypothetical protein PR048_004981 [Dryococelus australis]|uniref:Uncharacterized protein n=1 Tax=Dryococelus australis TaxID=614101 RepID=A0ABQ9I7T4_9NEOP|nr:hypothetical protein PR048_004981 [Dryococelus australis]